MCPPDVELLLSFLFSRKNKAIPAVPLRALGFRCLRWLDRTVCLVPSGRGASAHADSRRHRLILQHNSRDHAWDHNSRGSHRRTIQRPEHELGEGAHCCWDQPLHIWHHAQPSAQTAGDELLHPLNHMRVTERQRKAQMWLTCGRWSTLSHGTKKCLRLVSAGWTPARKRMSGLKMRTKKKYLTNY